jgi:hypothetical protein
MTSNTNRQTQRDAMADQPEDRGHMLWVYHVSNKPRSSTVTCGLESPTIFITTDDQM